jgi:hypothetical protein
VGVVLGPMSLFHSLGLFCVLVCVPRVRGDVDILMSMAGLGGLVYAIATAHVLCTVIHVDLNCGMWLAVGGGLGIYFDICRWFVGLWSS